MTELCYQEERKQGIPCGCADCCFFAEDIPCHCNFDEIDTCRAYEPETPLAPDYDEPARKENQ